MFSLFDNAEARLALTYGGLTLNDATDVLDMYRVDAVTTEMTFDAVMEQRQQADGAEIYEARKVVRRTNLDVTIVAPTRADLFDKMAELASTFDPALVSRNNPTTDGFIALDGSIPTTDIATYATGLIARRIYARPMLTPAPNIAVEEGFAARVLIPLISKDPRAYLQAESTDTIESGANVVDNTKADYPSFPTFTLTATGAGSATFSIAKTGGNTLTLDLTGLVNTDVVVVNMATHAITKNGVKADELFVSGGFFDLSAGNNTLTVTNPTNLTVALAWRPAFAL